MNRAGLQIREAREQDLMAIMHLTADVLDQDEGQSHAGVRRLLEGPSMRSRQKQFEKLLTGDDVRVIVAAEQDDDCALAGVAVLSEDAISAVFESPAVFVNYLLVPGGSRNRGVGKALLIEATKYAESVNAKHVIVGVSSTARETNRYYARLGFAPLVVRRIASIPHLRKSLGMNSSYSEGRGARFRSIGAPFSAISRGQRIAKARAQRPS